MKVNSIYRYLWMALAFMCVASHVMAVEEMPGKWGRSSVVFEDNDLYRNHFTGMRIRGDIPVTIKTSRIYLNGRAGIAIDRDAQVMVKGCDIFRNDRAGINIDEATATFIDNNRIHENKMGGIRIWRSGEEKHVSAVKIVNNKVYGNEQGGIRSMPQGDSKVELSIIENGIYGNKKGGVRVENNTKLTAKGNEIYENGTIGIIAHESTVPPELDIYQNRVSFNHGPGIHVLNGITGDIGIRNNWVFNNHRSGILCGLWSDPNKQLLNVKIINNTIVSNGSSGQGSGIRNDSKGKAFIINNIIAYNYITGIRVRTCKDYSYNLMFANGDVGNCCDDVHSAPSWIESLQAGGCGEREKGDLLGDPFFEDPDNYSFYLRDESPAIDAGKDDPIYNDVLSPPSKGTKRNDMGATGGPWAAMRVVE
jgi:parallel beta-helix repeat protein